MDCNFLTSLQMDPWVSSMEPLIYLENEKKSLELRFSKWLWSDSNHQSSDYKPNALTTRLPTAAAESMENLCYLCTDVNNVHCS